MQLRDALVDEFLRIGFGRGDWEANLAHAGDHVRSMTWPVVESFAVEGMTRRGNSRVSLRRRRRGLDGLVSHRIKREGGSDSHHGHDRRTAKLGHAHEEYLRNAGTALNSSRRLYDGLET